MKELLISKSSLKTKVDDDIYQLYKDCKIRLTPQGYATIGNKTLHSLIKQSEDGCVIDHKDQDKLNNQISNLNSVTPKQNSQNVKKYKQGTSKYKGVSQKGNKWQARSCNVYLGSFDTEDEAGYAYNIYSKMIYGEHCFQNGVEKPDSWDDDYQFPIKKEIILTEEYKQRKTDSNNKNITISNDIVNLKIKYKEKIYEVLIDFDKWNEIGYYSFWIKKGGYVLCREHYLSTAIALHRHLSEVTDPKTVVDHKNNNKLDNRKVNLRKVTHSQNGQNRIKKANTSSIYIGVTKTRNNTWSSRIRKDGINYGLGTYPTEIEAAIAYNIKCIELYGEGCKLNEIPEEYRNIVPQRNGKK